MEKIFKKLPEFEPDDKFIVATWNKIDSSNAGLKPHLFEIIINFVFVLSIVLLGITSMFGAYRINNNRIMENEEVIVEINLMPRSDSMASTENLLFVYDEAKNLEEIRADYKIENNILTLELKPGLYRIVFASEQYEDVVITKIVTKNG